MNLVYRHASRNMTNPCITIIEGDIAIMGLLALLLALVLGILVGSAHQLH